MEDRGGERVHDQVDTALPAAERLLFDVAGELDRGAPVALVDTATGLIPAAAKRWTQITVHCDRSSDERQVRAEAESRGAAVRVSSDPDEAVTGARMVLFRLPTALAALEQFAARVAELADPEVLLLGVGSSKHLTRTMNEVLGRSFTQVRASRGRGKHRVLIATGRRTEPGRSRFPRCARLDDLGLTVCAHGAAFAGARLDPGTRLLLGTNDHWPAPQPGSTTVDLGCGTGLIAATLARLGHRPVVALDDSWAACASARATARANGLEDLITVSREDGLTEQPAERAGLVVSNPPFHRGSGKDTTDAFAMITDAGRVLAPGGELWLVFNSHLPYLPALRRIGPTELITRDRSYLVTRTVRRR